ncbi:MAG: methyltransferase [Nitrospirales bacterium]|nr:MAG: methyltransferase [Nitrospirales bacterium]
MRVIAGTQKGRRLKAPIGNRIRPTSERVREALFSILNVEVSHANVLDLCCGTGTIGLEALSRGAARVVFVDNHRDSLLLLKNNIRRCGEPPNTVTLAGDAWELVRHPHLHRLGPFDIIYVDPPYQHDNLEQLLGELSAGQTLACDGMMVVEHFWKTVLPQDVGSVQQVRHARYGDTVLTFFQQTKHESHANRRVSGNI